MKEYGKSADKSLSGNIFIPGRNLALATLAACTYLPSELWLGALRGETHAEATDKNFVFASNSSRLLTYVLRPFLPEDAPSTRVRLPLAEHGLNKLTATKWALDNGISKETLMATSSCLSGVSGNCGECIVCLRRWGIFKQLGFEEQYNTHPLSVPHNLEIIEKLKNGTNYDRQVEILPALGFPVNQPFEGPEAASIAHLGF
jgi:7-cyano-7-deazaguanine synthase in queuosine biosynthesis